LFGGERGTSGATLDIFMATLSSPTVWGVSSHDLPYAISKAQFCTIGSKGFLFGPTTADVGDTKILSCELETPEVWRDTGFVIPGIVNHSQLGIIADRLWLFGGSGSSIIFADNQFVKYDLASDAAISYGGVTRTLYQAALEEDRFEVLGFPPWKTNYGA